MDLSFKRNNEVEEKEETTRINTEFTSVEHLDVDIGNVNEKAEKAETEICENQVKIPLENESREPSQELPEDLSTGGDKSKEGEIKEKLCSDLDYCEMADSRGKVEIEKEEQVELEDLDYSEMTDSRGKVEIEKEEQVELERKFENVVDDASESLKADDENSIQEKKEEENEKEEKDNEKECVQKNVQEEDSVEEVKNLTKEMITNGDKERENETTEEKIEQMEEEFEEVEEEEESISMPPENLFEYQWPPDRMGEWYFVQEQISEYLGVTSFKRKYPDLERRVMDMKEKDFLRERGVVTEEQVTLGLTALKSEDVYDLMVKDYNKKYTDYLKVLQEKERQNISNKHKEYEAPTVDTGKVKEYTQRAVKQAAEYNASLMRERREERQYFLDVQTMVVQVSKNKVKQIKKGSTKVDGYPVALIPGQFQNFYRKYTPEELNYFPLQTALYGPVELQDQRRLGQPGWEDEEEPISDFSEPGSPDHASAIPTTNIPPPAISMDQLETSQKEQQQILLSYKPKEIDDAICGICLKDKSCNKFNLPEELIHCAQCDNSGHPSCLEMNNELVDVIKTYPWQCMECKTCFCCGQPTDEDKMMFCDDCDRGYHTFCVGLQEIPTGKWACPSCLATQAKEKELAAAAAAAAAVPTPEPVMASTPSATPPPSKRRRSAKKRDL
ncbi:PHD finger protein 10-like isoform X3 [Anneissia japonica]|uniref:PHD finger protein 10-like isoform X3 n=1 Tax=Anneissia japonica TaxID=1529436 RepID=UPI0014256449|nr:PHD finger protein 10-like isoform X3 [Anneissia japonica]